MHSAGEKERRWNRNKHKDEWVKDEKNKYKVTNNEGEKDITGSRS